MKRTLLLAALAIASPAFAGNGDVDIIPYGYVSQVMHAAQADTRAASAAVSGSGEAKLAAVSTKTRGQVAAETREAVRLGLVAHGDMLPATLSPEQDSEIRRAGLRALASEASK